jgi:choline kinase
MPNLEEQIPDMRALILAAGVGDRLGGGGQQPPKSLLRFDGRSLLERHLCTLAECGVREVAVGVGYRAEEIEREIRRIDCAVAVELIHNPDYREGNVVTLWHMAERLAAGGDVLLMDADVLYHGAVMARLIGSAHRNCFLLDRNIEPGEEPVKLCVRDGRIVEFRKQIADSLEYDYHGESVGFFKLTEEMALALRETVEAYVEAERRGEFYEEALRDLVLGEQGHCFGFEDVTGLPWIEIDFPEDVEQARREVLPQLLDGTRQPEGSLSRYASPRSVIESRLAAPSARLP